MAIAARRPVGDPGVWVFVLADLAVFSAFFATFAWYRGRAPELFRDSQAALNQTFGLVNTLLLLAGSLAMVFSVHLARAGRTPAARLLVAAAIATGGGFGVSKILEYREKIAAGYTLISNDFFMFYYMLTGIHLAHVGVGVGVLAFLLGTGPRATQAYDARQLAYLESGGVVWHLVDLLWIVLFPMLYLLR